MDRGSAARGYSRGGSRIERFDTREVANMATGKRFRSDSFGPDGWRFGTDWRHIRAGLIDGIRDSREAARGSDGRHRAYLQTWRDPDGTCRADIIYPGSVVARVEADAAANGVRVRQGYSPMPLAEGIPVEVSGLVATGTATEVAT